jgi:predicted ATPase
MLILDNCEHVLDGVSALVDLLVRRCPNLTVVATSRERLAVGGEHVWPVSPLPVPSPSAREIEDLVRCPAVALFVERACAAEGGFRLDDASAPAVAEICRGLDGLPLALEIAAARLGALTVQELAGRLSERFALLTAGPRSEGERHRTLRAVVAWSHDLLDDAERTVFERLTVFAGGWTLEAAASLCSGEGVPASRVPGLVVSLAEKSIVIPPGPSAHGRYGMLETLRLYGAECLSARGEKEAASRAHARHFLALAIEAEVGLRGPDERGWVERLRAEFDNLRAAHAWCRDHGEADLALQLSAALHRFACWQANDEIFSWAESAAYLPTALGHRLRPVVLGSAGARWMYRGEMAQADEHANLALAECTGEDDPRRALPTEVLAGRCLLTGRLDEAFELSGEAARLWRLLADEQAVVWNLCSQAVAGAKQGRLAAAATLTEEARQLAASTGNPTMMAFVLYSQGECLLEVDPLSALTPIDEALRLATSAENVFMKGLALVSATSLRGRHGDVHRALGRFEAVIQHWQQSGHWTQQWITLRNLLELFSRVGAHEAAAVLYGACTASNAAPTSFGAEARRLDAVVAKLVPALGQQAFDEATERGARLGDEEAMSFALAAIRSVLGEEPEPGAPSE